MLALSLARDQKYLGLREARASRKLLSKQNTEELRPDEHSVGFEQFVTVLCVEIGSM
jgi:hypothetical protein